MLHASLRLVLAVLPLRACSMPLLHRQYHVNVAGKIASMLTAEASAPSPTSLSPIDDPTPKAQGLFYYQGTQLASSSPSGDAMTSSLATSSTPPPSTSTPVASASASLNAADVSSTASNPASSSPSSSYVMSEGDPLVVAYYADWTLWQRSPEAIDYTKFDVLNFAFAIPNEKFELSWDDSNSSPATLRRLVDGATRAGKKVVLSIGGWSGSKYFSPAVATESARQAFVSNILAAYSQFGLSGIDIDWEYPGHQGEGNNLVSSSDSQNFLAFLQLLRSSLPAGALITAAVATTPFVDAEQRPMNDVSQFAEILDYATIMAYDAFGASATPGPNAPFSDTCKNSTQPQANAVSAFEAWTSAGFPANKLLLGIAAYGYQSQSDATSLRARSTRPGHPSTVLHTRQDAAGGQVTFSALVKQGKLVKSSASPISGVLATDALPASTFAAGQNYTSGWDECSSTPFIYQAGEVYTYDDPVSLRMKATWVKTVGMRGVNMWSLDGDTDDWDLVSAVRSAFGRT